MRSWTRRELVQVGALLTTDSLLPVGPLSADKAEAAFVAKHTTVVPADAVNPRKRIGLDLDWRFHLGHACDPKKDFLFDSLEMYAKTGPMKDKTGRRPEVFLQSFDDSSWEPVDLPHDWAVGLPFENAPDNQGLMSHGWKPLGREYPASSIGWYRRRFHVDAEDEGKRTWVEFEGVMRDAFFMVNGYYLGRHESGYTPVRYDLTDFLEYGQENVLVVRVDATMGEGWFYEGAGIYRHVWLTTLDPLHILDDSVAARTMSVHGGAAELEIEAAVTYDPGLTEENAPGCQVAISFLDADGKQVARGVSERLRVARGAGTVARQRLLVQHAALWSPETPTLYRIVTQVETEGRVRDRHEVSFGIRTIAFDANRGFLLNGVPLKIQGTANHQDHAGVGVALPDALQIYRVRRLKQMGCNGYRSAHNPPSPALLDACDREGMLMMVELRSLSSAPYAIEQLETIVRRDRNHPSVVIWSLGNEEMVVQANDHGVRIVQSMRRRLKQLDLSRPCTVAMNEKSWGNGVTIAVDVQGFNYATDKELNAFHTAFPHLPMIGTETASMVSTRGIYRNDPAACYVSAYDVNKRPWSQAAEEWVPWYGLRPFVCGGFAWTGFDYRGEPSPYWRWPDVSSHFGILDTCGFFKDSAWYYKAWWGAEPVLHLFPHWDWRGREGQEIDVWCYCNLEEVELLVNGVSLGRKRVVPYGHLSWMVRYEAGAIEARGYRKDKLLLRQRRETTGPAARLRLQPSKTELRADGMDATVIDVAVQDAAGETSPLSDALVQFSLSGPGVIFGVGNGNPTSLEPDKATERRAFNGLCQVIVRAGRAAGPLRLTARSAGLEESVAVMQTR